jgi:hypothetical protein
MKSHKDWFKERFGPVMGTRWSYAQWESAQDASKEAWDFLMEFINRQDVHIRCQDGLIDMLGKENDELRKILEELE